MKIKHLLQKNLATTDTLTAAKNKIPNTSNLVKRYQTLKVKISSHFISNNNKFMNNILDGKVTKNS